MKKYIRYIEWYIFGTDQYKYLRAKIDKTEKYVLYEGEKGYDERLILYFKLYPNFKPKIREI